MAAGVPLVQSKAIRDQEWRKCCGRPVRASISDRQSRERGWGFEGAVDGRRRELLSIVLCDEEEKGGGGSSSFGGGGSSGETRKKMGAGKEEQGKEIGEEESRRDF